MAQRKIAGDTVPGIAVSIASKIIQPPKMADDMVVTEGETHAVREEDAGRQGQHQQDG